MMEIILTPLSRETLEYLKQGMSAKEIADKQSRSLTAVERTLESLRKKFNAKNSIHLVVLYIEGIAA